jgi:hypothetical protein
MPLFAPKVLPFRYGSSDAELPELMTPIVPVLPDGGAACCPLGISARSAPRSLSQLQAVCRVAPGGVEPPHADSKSAALSAELRGPQGQSSRAP